MSDTKVDTPTTEELVSRASATFMYQLAQTHRPSYTEVERGVLSAAFNNALVELVITLEEACDALRDTAADNLRARNELAQLQSLEGAGSAGIISVAHRVSLRARKLSAAACSRCGAVRHEDETDALVRARLGDPSNRRT